MIFSGVDILFRLARFWTLMNMLRLLPLQLLDAVGSMILHQQSGSATDVTLEQVFVLTVDSLTLDQSLLG